MWPCFDQLHSSKGWRAEAEVGHRAHSLSEKWFSTYPWFCFGLMGMCIWKVLVCWVRAHFTDLSLWISELYNYRVLDMESSCWQVRGNSVQLVIDWLSTLHFSKFTSGNVPYLPFQRGSVAAVMIYLRVNPGLLGRGVCVCAWEGQRSPSFQQQVSEGATAFMVTPSVNGAGGTHRERDVISDRLCTALAPAITPWYHPTFIQFSSSVHSRPKGQQTG